MHTLNSNIFAPGYLGKTMPLIGNAGREAPRFEAAFVVFMLTVFLGPFAQLFPGDPLTGSPEARILFAVLYIIAGILLFREFLSRPAAFRLTPLVCILLALLILSVASTAWSILPHITLRRSLALIGTTIVGLYLGSRFRTIDMLRLVGASFALVLVVTISLYLFFPERLTHQEVHPGALHGLFYHKNLLGAAMVQAIITFVALASCRAAPQQRAFMLGLTAMAVLLLLSADSATAILAMCAFLLALFLLHMPQMTRYVLLILSIGVLLTLAGIVQGGFCTLSLLGRDCTITGRTEIWTLVWFSVMERPWLGYGYGAFWPADSAFGNAIRDHLGWRGTIADAHSAWLDTWLSLGLLGVLLLLLIMSTLSIKAFRRAASKKDRARDPWTIWSLGFLISLWVYCTNESFLSYNSAMWVFLTALIVKTENFGQYSRKLDDRRCSGTLSPIRDQGT